MAAPTPRFFETPAEFRRWLEKNHATAREIIVGFYKKDSGRGGMVYRDALDEALCFGWIDGVVRRIDDESYCQRFTPRKPGSIWSKINVGHVERLKSAGKMTPAGLAAFEARTAARTGVYSFENQPRELPPAAEKQFRKHAAAWKFWQEQPPGYRRQMIWWIVSAKQESTQQRRLEKLIESSAQRVRL